jgi:hypothetical protein
MLAFLSHRFFLPPTENILLNDYSQGHGDMKQGFKFNSRKLTLSITIILKYNLEGMKQQAGTVTAEYPRPLANICISCMYTQFFKLVGMS